MNKKNKSPKILSIGKDLLSTRRIIYIISSAIVASFISIGIFFALKHLEKTNNLTLFPSLSTSILFGLTLALFILYYDKSVGIIGKKSKEIVSKQQQNNQEKLNYKKAPTYPVDLILIAIIIVGILISIVLAMILYFFEKVHSLGLESQLPQFITPAFFLTTFISIQEITYAIEEAKKSDNDEQDEANKPSNDQH